MSASDEAIQVAGAGSPLPSEFRFGTTLRTAFTAFFRHLGILFLPALLVVAVERFLLPPLTSAPAGIAELGELLIALAVMMLCYQVLSSISIHAVVTDLQGRPASPGSSLARAIATFWRCLAAGLLVSIGIVLGLALLVVPGVILMIALVAVIPVCVMENAGARDSLARSWALTRGHRLTILGLFIATILISAIATTIPIMILELAMAGSASLARVRSIIGSVFDALSLSLSIALMGSIYALLVAAEKRRATDGTAALPA